MKKQLLFIACLAGGISYGQSTLYQNTFEGVPGFNLNTTDLGGTTSAADNPWIINNLYAGGSGSFFCTALATSFPFSVPAAPSQPTGITNNPNSTYLHVTPQIAIDAGGSLPVASYVTADGFCILGGETVFAEMSTDISTVGYDSISLDLWWMCGGSTSYYGEVYYSTDGGATWASLICPTTGTAQWRNQASWVNHQVTNANLDGQATLRLGFRFNTGTGSTGADPGFAIDDISIVGYTACTPTSSTVNANACFDYTSPSGNYTWTATGSYNDTIPNMAGCDSVITVNLTIDGPDLSVSMAGTTLMANQAGGTYQWLNCDDWGVVSGATGQVFNPTTNGNYAVMVTLNGCSDTSSCSTISGIGFEEDFLSDVTIYPNPTEGNVYLDLTSVNKLVTVLICDIKGTELERKAIMGGSLQEFRIEVENGIYIIQIVSDDLVKTSLITKQ